MSQLNVNTISPQSGSTVSFTGTISGSDLKLSGDVTAQRFIVSSSVTKLNTITNSGSTAFGDSLDDTHIYTGSLQLTGSITASKFSGDGSGLSNVFEGTAPSASISTRLTSFTDGTVTLVSGSSTSTGSFGLLEIAGATFASDGNDFGIGTTTPTSPSGFARTLQISTPDDGASIVFTSDNDGTARHFEVGNALNGRAIIWNRDNSSNGYIQIGTDSKERVRITKDGDVGIGTTNPVNKLEVHGDAYITGSISGSVTSTGSFGTVQIGGQHMYGDSTGIGIGVSDPQGLLHVQGGETLLGTDTIAAPGYVDEALFINSLDDINTTFHRDSNSTGAHTGIGFGVWENGYEEKGAIFFERLGSYGYGRLKFAVDSRAAQNTVTPDYTVMQIESHSVHITSSFGTAADLLVDGNISGSVTSTGSFGSGFFDGRVGIYQKTPTAELHISSPSSQPGIRVDGGYANIQLEGDNLAHISLKDEGATSGERVYQISSDGGILAFNRTDDGLSSVTATPLKIKDDKVEVLNISGSTTSTGSFGKIELNVANTSLDPFHLNFHSKGNMMIDRGRVFSFDHADYRHGFIRVDSSNYFLNLVGYYGVEIGGWTTQDAIKYTDSANKLDIKANLKVSKEISGSKGLWIGNPTSYISSSNGNIELTGNISGSVSSTGSFGKMVVGTSTSIVPFHVNQPTTDKIAIFQTPTSGNTQGIVVGSSTDGATNGQGFHLGYHQSQDFGFVDAYDWGSSAYQKIAFNLNMYVVGQGNVGIGVSDPDAKLEVAGTTHFQDVSTFDSSITAAGNISGSATSTGSFGAARIVDKFGIGVANPNAKIDIQDNNGTIKIGTQANNNPEIRLTGTGVYGANIILDGANSGHGAVSVKIEDFYLGQQYGAGGDFHIDTTLGGSMFCLTSDGNLGLGTNSPEQTLDVRGNIVASGNITAQNYIVSSSVTYMTQSFSSGSTIFGDDSDDTHIFTGSLQITGGLEVQNGDVSIGTTSPDMHLHVHGTEAINGYVKISTSRNSSYLKLGGDTPYVESVNDNLYFNWTSAQTINIGQNALKVTHKNQTGGPKVTSLGPLEVQSHVSASGNITGSGNLEIAGNISGSATSTGSFGLVDSGRAIIGESDVFGGTSGIGTTTKLYVQSAVNQSAAAIKSNGSGHALILEGPGNNFLFLTNGGAGGNDDWKIGKGDYGLRVLSDKTNLPVLELRPEASAADTTAALTITNASGVRQAVITSGDGTYSGSLASTGSFGHIMKGGVNWDTAVSASAAAGGFGGGGGSGTGFPFVGEAKITGSLIISGTTGPTTASLHITDTSYADTHILSESLVVAVDGNNGRLFSVTDQMTGSLFSANTVAGLPVIEAFSDNKVTLGPFSNQTVIDSDGNMEIGGNISGSLSSTASFGHLTVGVGKPGDHPGADNFRVRAATNQLSRFISTSESTPSSIRVGSNGTYWELSARGDGGGDGATLFYNRANPNGIQIGTDRASVSRDLELGHMTAGGTAGVSLVADGESKLMVKSTGLVGIGTTSPTEKLHLSGSGTTTLFVEGNISSSAAGTGSFGRVEGNIVGQRPMMTHMTDFSASMAYAGHYNIVNGNMTCSILHHDTASVDIGTEFEFFQTGSSGRGLFFETGSSGVTVMVKNNNWNLAGQYSGATLKKVAQSTWHLVGDLT